MKRPAAAPVYRRRTPPSQRAGTGRIVVSTHIPAKSLMRMLGPKGSPSAANLSSILTALQMTEGIQFDLALKR